MKKLELYFSNSARPELYRIVFQHPLSGAERISIRGKDTGAYLNAFTFQWTQAVKALCVLILRSANNSIYVLEGSKGTLASSLDYSIAKNTQWISDVFGVDAQGKSLARRLFKRTNSDRIYDGPVGVSLSSMLFDRLSIKVFLDNRELATNEFIRISSLIEGTAYVEAIIPDSQQTSVPNLKSYLSKIYEKEFTESIFKTEIFSPLSLNNSLSAVKQAGFYRKIAQRDLALYDSKLQVNGRLGIGYDYSHAKALLEDLNIIGSSTLIGPIVLFHYLSLKHQVTLNYNFNYAHAVGAVRMIINGEIQNLPDVLFAAIAPAATLAGSKFGKEYIPLMLMPESSQKIVAHKSAAEEASSLNHAVYSLLKEDPSIPGLMIDELHEMGKINKNKVKFQHDEPDESFYNMRQGDPDLRAALFFPHYNFNCDFNNCITLPDMRARPNSQEVILFVHRRKASIPNFMQTLESLIRDAWLDLRVSPHKIKESIDNLFNTDNAYYNSVVRFGGLHSIRTE